MTQLSGTTDIAAGKRTLPPILKAPITTVANSFSSLWYAAGYPGAGAAATVAPGANCDDSKVGAMPLATLVSLEDIFLSLANLTNTVTGTLVLYDRVYECGGINGNGAAATPQNVNPSGTPVLPARAGNGEDLEAWLEWQTVGGVTTQTWTGSYTDSGNTAGRALSSISAVGASVAANRLIPLFNNTGGAARGIKSIQTVTPSAASGTANVINVLLLKKLAMLPITTASIGLIQDWLQLNIPGIGKFGDKPCLMLAILATGTSSGTVTGELGTVVK
jgi:hypothetical protein